MIRKLFQNNCKAYFNNNYFDESSNEFKFLYTLTCSPYEWTQKGSIRSSFRSFWHHMWDVGLQGWEYEEQPCWSRSDQWEGSHPHHSHCQKDRLLSTPEKGPSWIPGLQRAKGTSWLLTVLYCTLLTDQGNTDFFQLSDWLTPLPTGLVQTGIDRVPLATEKICKTSDFSL